MADKSFGIKELNLIGASGTPTITSPNNLNLNASNVAISTDVTIGRHLDVDGHAEFDNIRTSGITTLASSGGITTTGGDFYTAGDINFTGNLYQNGTLFTSGSGAGSTDNVVTNSLVVTGIATFQQNIYLGNNDRINLGGTNDLQIYNTGSNSYIADIGVGDLYLLGTAAINLQNSAGSETYAKFNVDGASELYYDNSKKFETTGAGVTVTGTTFSNQLNVAGVSTFNDDVHLGDGDDLYFGNDNDLRISHSGSDATIYNSTGNITVTTAGTFDLLSTSSERLARFTPNGSSELYHNNSKKLETTSGGIDVTGHTETDTLRVSGVSTFQGGIHDGTSLGTSGQILSSTGTGLSWIDAAGGGIDPVISSMIF